MVLNSYEVSIFLFLFLFFVPFSGEKGTEKDFREKPLRGFSVRRVRIRKIAAARNVSKEDAQNAQQPSYGTG